MTVTFQRKLEYGVTPITLVVTIIGLTVDVILWKAWKTLQP